MKLKRTTSLAMAVLAVFALLAASCGDDSDDAATTTAAPAATTAAPATTAGGGDGGGGSQGGGTVEGGRTAPAEPFRLGALMPLTGDLSVTSEPIWLAAQLAVEEINDIGIQEIEFDLQDSGTNPEVANNTVDGFIAGGTQGIIGAVASSISLSVLDKVAAAGIPMMSPANGSPTLTTYPDMGYYFRTTTPDVLKGSVMGQLILNRGGQDIAIMHRADDWGRAFAEQTAIEFEEGGGNVLVNVAYDPQVSTYGAEIQQVTNAGADSIVLITFDEGLEITRQLLEEGFGPDVVDVYVPDTLALQDLGERVNPDDPSVVDGMVSIRPGSWDEGEQAFSDRLQARFPGTDEYYTSYAFDAIVVMALAALSAESNDPDDYTSHISEVTYNGEKCNFYVDCAQLLLDGADIDYDGASGPLEFSGVGESTVGVFEVMEFNNAGTFEIISKETGTIGVVAG